MKLRIFVFNNFHKILFRYTDKGEIKSKTISFNDELDNISAYTKKNGKTELQQQMNIKEMESCVRSCTTAAFSKSKGLFTKSKLILNFVILYFY